MLANIFQERLADDGIVPDIEEIMSGFKALAAAQQTFKAFDGASHELYQRTQDGAKVDLKVRGRAIRSATRVGVAADALGACELCELVENPERFDFDSRNGTLVGKEVIFNQTGYVLTNGETVNALILYEPGYTGGMGKDHGGIEDVGSGTKVARGRLLVVLGDSCCQDLERTIKLLDYKPKHIHMREAHMEDEVVSVQPLFYKTASAIYSDIKSILKEYNETAIHFTGRSIAGGVATIAATITQGTISPQRKKQRAAKDQDDQPSAVGKGRTSAVTLGSPPSISSNLRADYVTTILYGDDIVPRATQASIERFLKRARKTLNKGFFGVGRKISWMTDTVSLATSSLKAHAHGSEGEESKLAIAGRGYLIRPRRLGDACSIHEVGSQLKGGREALRASVLWQLNDILLSKSLWKHHQLNSYISGIDRLHLRGVGDQDEPEESI